MITSVVYFTVFCVHHATSVNERGVQRRTIIRENKYRGQCLDIHDYIL
jgi:hypothetical protein